MAKVKKVKIEKEEEVNNEIVVVESKSVDRFPNLPITEEILYHQFMSLLLSPEAQFRLREFFHIAEQKNQEYGDAWQIDGMLTSLTDDKDKLYRVDTIKKNGAVVGHRVYWDDNLSDKLMDIMLRSLMGIMKLDQMNNETKNSEFVVQSSLVDQDSQ